ncbi:hypothetical protein BD408DRAFT_423615, partial [Parasitella parasitica]
MSKMNIPTTGSSLLTKYHEQNVDIIKTNIRLNERISMLESVVTQLQQENIQLRMDKVKKSKLKRKVITPKKRTFDAAKTQRENIPKAKQDNINEAHSKRSCSNKTISYLLPSTKCKLRKGDPHTFGN